MKVYIIQNIFSVCSDRYYYMMNSDIKGVYTSKDDAIAKVQKYIKGTQERFGGTITIMEADEVEVYHERLDSFGDRFDLKVIEKELK